MQWLANWYFRDGPGIPKGLPKKRGLALFAEIAGREAIELFKLNLLVILFSLPLVTIFAAQAAGLRIANAMVRDEPVYLVEDYWRAFRELFVAASLTGAMLSVALGLSAYAVFVYAQLALSDLAFAPLLTLAGVTLVAVAVFAVNLFAPLVDGAKPRAAARLALRATLVAPLPGLGALAFVGGLWLVHVLFYPVSVFMPVAVNFSLGLLAFAFAASASAGRVEILAARTPQREPSAGTLQQDGVEDAEWEKRACVN